MADTGIVMVMPAVCLRLSSRVMLGLLVMCLLTVARSRAQEAELRPHPSVGSRFGGAVVITHDRLLVAAPGDARRGGPEAAWELVDKLVPSDTEEGIEFGQQVAVDGRWLLVGAPAARVVTEHGGLARARAVYLFERTGAEPSSWRHTARLEPPSGRDGDRFGATLAIDDGMIAIGAPDSDAMGKDTGSVDLLALREGEGPTHLARLAVPTIFGGDRYGSSIDLRGDRIFVGAPGTGGAAGASYVYDVRAAHRDAAHGPGRVRRLLLHSPPPRSRRA